MNITRLKKRLAKLKKITKASDRTGWMIDEIAYLLYALVKFYKPNLIIQIGHLWGKSAVFLLEALTDSFLMDGERIEEGILSGDKKFFSFVKSQWPKVKKGKLISVDAFPYGNWEKGIAYFHKQYGKDRFEFIVKKSDDFFKDRGKEILKKYAGKTIIGIVDGDHSYKACMNDLISMAKLGADHIIVDDLQWLPHLHEVCKEFTRIHPKYSLSTFLAYNGLAVLNKKTK